MALNLAPEDRFALDVYSDPTLSIDEKLARLRAYGAQPANDPTAAPVNDNGLPAIPAGPGIPGEATADLTGVPRVALGGPKPAQMRLDAPPVAPASPVQIVDAPTGPFGSAIPQTVPIGTQLPGQIERKDIRVVDTGTPDPFGLGSALPQSNGLVLPTNEQIFRDRAEINAETEQAVGAKPSDLVFADASTAPSQQLAPQPQFAVVGTDTFQPHSRTVRAGFTPTTPIAGGEPEFTADPKTGELVITGEPPQETPLEPLLTSAKQDELGAKRDLQEAREYGDAASLRADQAAEGRAQKIEDDAIARANDRAARLKQKEDAFQSVLADVTNPDHPSGQDAYFAKRGTGAQFAAGLAIAFGELGAALHGSTQNTARDIIFKAIDDEIQAGRERRAARIKGAETAYDLARDQFESEALQDAAVKQMMLGRVAREAARFKQFAQTPERKAAVDEQIAFWEGQEIEADIARKRLMGDEVVEQQRFDPRRTVQVGGGKLKEDHRKRRIVLPDGSEAFVRDSGARKDTQDSIKTNASISRTAERIRRLRQQPGAKTDPKVRSEIEGAAADLFLALKAGANLGTLDKGSLEFRDEWVGKPLDLIDFGGADAKLSEIGRAAANRNRDTMRYDLDRDPDQPSPVIGEDTPMSAERGAAK